MTLNPRCENVETAQGVPLTVTGVAQVKVSFVKLFYVADKPKRPNIALAFLNYFQLYYFIFNYFVRRL